MGQRGRNEGVPLMTIAADEARGGRGRRMDQAGSLGGEDVVWRPTQAQIERSQMLRFASEQGCASVNDLRIRGAADPAWFWEAMIEELGIEWPRPPRTTLDLSEGKAWAKWFP